MTPLRTNRHWAQPDNSRSASSEPAGPARASELAADARSAYPLVRDCAEHRRLAQQAEFWAADAAALFESAALAPGSRVADLGCGTLHVATALRRSVGAGGTVFAVDSDVALLDASANADPCIVPQHGDAYAMPWSDDSLDAVHARFLAAPAGRLETLIAEMRRLVRRGGVLMLQEPVADSWDVPAAADAWPSALELIRAGFRKRGGDFDVGRRLVEALRAAGLHDIRSRSVSHTMSATHPYARLPLAFCDSLAPLWRAEGIAGDAQIAVLRRALERGLAEPGAQVTTFMLVQAWARA
jgi:ubiquinone/menaquinone biosynthesis C-methylase UbiE